MKSARKLLIVLLFITEYGCESKVKNYRDAYLVTQNDTTYIKLRGRRVSMHFEGTYEDSILIPISKTEGKIDAKDIPIVKGNYNYKGYLLVDGPNLTVNLLIDNTDDHKITPETWNGQYSLRR